MWLFYVWIFLKISYFIIQSTENKNGQNLPSKIRIVNSKEENHIGTFGKGEMHVVFLKKKLKEVGNHWFSPWNCSLYYLIYARAFASIQNGLQSVDQGCKLCTTLASLIWLCWSNALWLLVLVNLTKNNELGQKEPCPVWSENHKGILHLHTLQHFLDNAVKKKQNKTNSTSYRW